jgi:hypothetical protein
MFFFDKIALYTSKFICLRATDVTNFMPECTHNVNYDFNYNVDTYIYLQHILLLIFIIE